jgi:hypothetical protein
MKLIPDFIARFFVATELPTQPPPKPPKPGGLGLPGYRRTVAATSDQIPKPVFEVANVDLSSTYRVGTDTLDIVRNLGRVSPELSASIVANNRIGIPANYIAIARDPDGQFNEDATRLALQFLRQLDTMPDYINGFSQVSSLRATSEALGKQIQTTGAMAMELVLDKARLPFQFRALPTRQIFFFNDGTGMRPVQRIGGQDLDLDVPTFFYTSVDQDLLDAYAQSPLESAIQPVIASTNHLNDMRRLCQRNAYQRYDIELVWDKIQAMAPADVLQNPDPKVVSAYLNGLLDQAQTMISNLGPEQAMVHFDFFTIKYIEGSNDSMPDTFETVRNIYDGKIATASKTPGSIIGLGATTQNMSSSETLMFMVNANGLVRLKLMELYSKALTLALRLLGNDVTVEFIFDDIDLRPANELEAYKAMKQSRILAQLSFGMITDAEACLLLTGQLPPPGMPALSGTRFPVVPSAAPAENGSNTSQTSNMSQNSNKAPAAAKGSTKGAKK